MSEVNWPSPYSWHKGTREGMMFLDKHQYFEKAVKPPSISCDSSKLFVSTSTNLLFYILTLGFPYFARNHVCMLADLVFDEYSRKELEVMAMETEKCPGFQKARGDWEALNLALDDLSFNETDPLFMLTLGRGWASSWQCRTRDFASMIKWSSLTIILTLPFLIFHDPRRFFVSCCFSSICFTSAFNCLILSIAQMVQFGSMEESFNAIEWVLAIRPPTLTPNVWWDADLLVLPNYFKMWMIIHAICAVVAFPSDQQLYEILPKQFYALLAALVVLSVFCVSRFIFVVSLYKRRNAAMSESWKEKARKIISGYKPWDLY